MRNLKRALSLALASVMLMGMMVVGTSAAYNDVDSEDNVEAIEVLKTVGIMVGDENDNFNPDALLTRQEMAVVMSNLMDYRVASYKGTAPFADVADWAEPYVAACYTNGITAGMGENYYGANENVTTAQAALMLMKALGYFQYESDFEGDWTLATVRQANKIELFDDVEAGVRDAMTRNELAQLVLNTLESGMVEADDDTIKVTTNDATVEAGSVNYSYVTSSKTYARAIGRVNPAGNTAEVSTAGWIVELGEKLYEGDLKKIGETRDSYGRPAVRWDYKLDKIGDFAEDPIAVYTAKVSKGELYSLLGKDRINDVSNRNAYMTVAIDGAYNAYYGTRFDAIKGSYFVKDSSLAVAKDGANEAGKGVITEVYLDSDTGDISIVTINTYVMQATVGYNEDKDEIQVAVKTGPSTASRISGEDFDVSGVKKDDYLLYTYVNGGIEDLYLATTVSGNIDAYSVNNNVTLDGTKYDYALRIDATSKATVYRVNDTASVVLDNYGYVIFVDDAAVSMGNYVYLDGVAKASGLGSKIIAKLYFTDGTKDEVTLDDLYAYNATTETNLSGADTVTTRTWDGWYTYSKNSDGEYTLRGVDPTAEVDALTAAISGEKIAFTTGMKGNANTVMIVDDGDDVTVFTGIESFPDIAATTTNSYGLKEKADASKTYIGVVLVKTEESVMPVDSSTMLYVLNEDSHYVDTEDNERIDIMNVILNGEFKQVECKHGDLTAGVLYGKIKVDSDGYYKGITTYASVAGNSPADEHYNAVLSDAQVAYSGNTLSVGANAYVVTDDTNIIMICDSANASAGAAKTLMQNAIMNDRDADYEYDLGISGETVEARLNKLGVDGTLSVIADDNDSEIAETIILVIKGAHQH